MTVFMVPMNDNEANVWPYGEVGGDHRSGHREATLWGHSRRHYGGGILIS